MTTHTLSAHPPEFIRLLANDVRWGVLKLLASGDHKVNELVAALEQPMNLVSYHLKKMREEALVTTRRSEADGRDVYYSLDLDRFRQLFLEAGQALHPAVGQALPAVEPARLLPQRILFVCTHNSARSQMAEGLLRHLSQGRLEVFSAGSHPTRIHRDAVRTMERMGIDLRGQQPRALALFADQPFDYVITVCDKARELCPTFPGSGQQLHWGFPDPVAIDDDDLRAKAFAMTAQRLKNRIAHFMSTLPTSESES
ncbi:MAG: metalloregulator ArsR/SmtB family transcription factor [Chloroflexi bacterium]|nr:metalloregulator ArsR/SmtB family transcription factor [Chloroflexota bacterium]